MKLKQPDIKGFYSGLMEGNKEPSLVAMVFSLVTTWIFSRSLLTAAILAYYYGLPGALAYTAYYFSFLTGGYFIVNLRKKLFLKLYSPPIATCSFIVEYFPDE